MRSIHRGKQESGLDQTNLTPGQTSFPLWTASAPYPLPSECAARTAQSASEEGRCAESRAAVATQETTFFSRVRK